MSDNAWGTSSPPNCKTIIWEWCRLATTEQVALIQPRAEEKDKTWRGGSNSLWWILPSGIVSPGSTVFRSRVKIVWFGTIGTIQRRGVRRKSRRRSLWRNDAKSSVVLPPGLWIHHRLLLLISMVMIIDFRFVPSPRFWLHLFKKIRSTLVTSQSKTRIKKKKENSSSSSLKAVCNYKKEQPLGYKAMQRHANTRWKLPQVSILQFKVR